MSKIFTEFSVQQRICLFPKPSAKNPNALWLLLSHKNALRQLTHQSGKALARHQAVSVLPPEHFAHQTPSHAEVTSPHQKTHSSMSCPVSTSKWSLAFATHACLVTTTVPASPPAGWWPWQSPVRLPGVSARLPRSPSLNSGHCQVPLSLRLLLAQRLPKGNGLWEASPVTSVAEGKERIQTREREEEEEEGTSVWSSKSCFLRCLGAAPQCCGQ